MVNLIGTASLGDDWLRILDASNDFLRANLVPPMRVPGYAWDRFVQTGGTANTWVSFRPPPSRDGAGLRPLGDGEVRLASSSAPLLTRTSCS